jgi:hypothetical protein
MTILKNFPVTSSRSELRHIKPLQFSYRPSKQPIYSRIEPSKVASISVRSSGQSLIVDKMSLHETVSADEYCIRCRRALAIYKQRRQACMQRRQASVILEVRQKERNFRHKLSMFNALKGPEQTETEFQSLAVAFLEWKAHKQEKGAPIPAPWFFKRTNFFNRRPTAYIKDWVNGRVRPRTMTDDHIDSMTPEKRANHIARVARDLDHGSLSLGCNGNDS